MAHGGVQRHFFEQIAEVPQRVARQRVPVVRHGVAAPGKVQPRERDHKKLGQGQRQPFAYRVGRRHELVPDHVVAGVEVVEVARGVINHTVATCVEPVPAGLAQGRIKLLRQPVGIILFLHGCDLGVRGRKLRLQQKPRRFFGRLGAAVPLARALQQPATRRGTGGQQA